MDVQDTFRQLRDRAAGTRQAAHGRIILPWPEGWDTSDLEAFAHRMWRVLSRDAPLGDWISEPVCEDLVDRGRLGASGGMLVRQAPTPEARRTEVWAMCGASGVVTAFAEHRPTDLIIDVHAPDYSVEPVMSLALGLLPA